MLDLGGGAHAASDRLTRDDVPLEASGDGRLFAQYYQGLGDAGFGPAIIQLDPLTGNPITQVEVPLTRDDLGHPFALWAGDISLFPPVPAADAGAAAQTDVVRLHPGTTTREAAARIDGAVVTASTSPCAPAE